MIRNNVIKILGGKMELPAADNYLIELAEAWRERHRMLTRQTLTETSLICRKAHSGAYRALPSRRKYIPKSDGKQRQPAEPLGNAPVVILGGPHG
jgi:hypothetical protein